MQNVFLVAAATAGFVSTVSAHGYITEPTPRAVGDKYKAVCGEQIYNNQKSDQAGPSQLIAQQSSSIVDPEACNLWLCKGYQYETDGNVETFSLGQEIPIKVTIVAPHTGSANVSIVDTATNSVIGEPLISWDEYASTSSGVTDDQTSFSVTMPSSLDGCTTAGECVLQWYWYAPPGVDQTYESCIDFTVGSGSGSGSGNSTTTKRSHARSWPRLF